MAKLFKHVGASLRGRTHDDSDAAMRDRGATGVFRNLAFQEEDDLQASASKTAPSMSAPMAMANHKKAYVPSGTDTSSIDSSPRSREAHSAWAIPPVTPPAMWATPSATGKALGPQTPAKSSVGSQGPSSAVKRGKNAPQVDEITAFHREGPISEAEECGGGEGGVITVRHRGGSVCAPPPACTSTSLHLWEDDVKRLISCGRHEDAVRLVAPSDGMVRCTVRRVKNFLGHTLAYHLYLDSGDAFILAARKRKKSKASNFVLSTSQEELSRESSHCIAKLRANFVGTEYALVGRTSGCSAAGASDDEYDGVSGGGVSGGGASGRLAPSHGAFSREELAVHYKQTALKTKGGPRIMLVSTPLPDGGFAPAAADGSDSLASCLELARRRELPPRLERQLCMLATRPPEWDPAAKAYTLDFHGRVRAASVKNFQLVHWDHNTDRKGADLVLQYGKVEEGSDDFALDFTYPLNLEKAFAIALASTDSKLCTAI